MIALFVVNLLKTLLCIISIFSQYLVFDAYQHPSYGSVTSIVLLKAILLWLRNVQSIFHVYRLIPELSTTGE